MARLIAISIAAVLAAFPVMAEDAIVITAIEDEIVITSTECRLLVQHVPAADVAYEPGVDVDGNAVAPADIGNPEISLPDEISIDVTALVYELLSATPPPGLRDTAITLAAR